MVAFFIWWMALEVSLKWMCYLKATKSRCFSGHGSGDVAAAASQYNPKRVIFSYIVLRPLTSMEMSEKNSNISEARVKLVSMWQFTQTKINMFECQRCVGMFRGSSHIEGTSGSSGCQRDGCRIKKAKNNSLDPMRHALVSRCCPWHCCARQWFPEGKYHCNVAWRTWGLEFRECFLGSRSLIHRESSK